MNEVTRGFIFVTGKWLGTTIRTDMLTVHQRNSTAPSGIGYARKYWIIF